MRGPQLSVLLVKLDGMELIPLVRALR